MFSVTTNTYILPSTTKTVAKIVYLYDICNSLMCFFIKNSVVFAKMKPFLHLYLIFSFILFVYLRKKLYLCTDIYGL